MRLALLAEAEAELDDAATWYDDRSEGLGDEFMDVAREAMALVVDSPETWPLWPGHRLACRRSAVSVATLSIRDRVSSLAGPRGGPRDRA